MTGASRKYFSNKSCVVVGVCPLAVCSLVLLAYRVRRYFLFDFIYHLFMHACYTHELIRNHFVSSGETPVSIKLACIGKAIIFPPALREKKARVGSIKHGYK